MVDALVSGASGFAIVQVRVLFWALPKIEKMQSYTEEDLKRVSRNVSYETDKYHKNYLWVLCRSCDQGAALGVDSRTELRRISSTG